MRNNFKYSDKYNGHTMNEEYEKEREYYGN